MFSSAKGRKDQVWIWDSFENFFQMTVVGQNLLIFLVVFRINSRDLVSSAHVDAVSVGCNRREKRCFIFHWTLLLCLMLWAAENQKKTTNTAGGEVCVNGGEKVRWVQVLLQNSWKTWIRLVLLLLLFCPSLIYINIIFVYRCYSHYPRFLTAHSPIFYNPFRRNILDFSRPSKTSFISHLSSSSSFTFISSCCSIFSISLLTEDHLRQSVLSLHTPSSSMRMTFFPLHIPYKALSSSDLLSTWRLKLTASCLWCIFADVHDTPECKIVFCHQ